MKITNMIVPAAPKKLYVRDLKPGQTLLTEHGVVVCRNKDTGKDEVFFIYKDGEILRNTGGPDGTLGVCQEVTLELVIRKKGE